MCSFDHRSTKVPVLKVTKLKPSDMDYSNLLEMENMELKTSNAADPTKDLDKGSDNEVSIAQTE